LEVALKEDAEREPSEKKPDSSVMSNAGSPLPQSVQSELERYGIGRVPAEIFVWGGYRYSNASDAIAAARLAERR